jgi:hypothetical protein
MEKTGGMFSALQNIFLFFLQENILRKAFIPFIGVRLIVAGGKCKVWLVLGVVLLVAPHEAWTAGWKPLTDTGQARCYDALGAEMTCPPEGQPLSGQDAQFPGRNPACQDNGNQTISDGNSGLMWMKSDDGVPRKWRDAIDYCNGLDFAGHSDWRLPKRFELDSIVDYGRSHPALDPIFDCQASFYWSLDPYKDDPIYAWGILFNDGGDHWLDKNNKYYVRCVRGKI